MGEIVKTKQKLYFIDVLKGLGAIIIVLHHLGLRVRDSGSAINRLQFFQQYGYLAVEMFFFLSGFSMAYAYRDAIYKGKLSFETYLKKRLLRLYPLFLLATLIVGMCWHLILYVTGGGV